jgi:nitrite reductase (NADH) large subunit
MTRRNVKRFVVIGASAAGATAVETIRRLDSSCSITLVSEEPVPVYSRCLLPKYLAGEVSLGRLRFQGADWPRSLEVDIIQERAIELDPGKGEVLTASGRKIPYTGLLLATGSTAILPSLPGINTPGVYLPYRLDQVSAALEAARHARQIVVLGAGQVGVKMAEALVRRGKQVTLVEQASYPFWGVLDRLGGKLVSRHLANQGVQLRCETTLLEVSARRGRVCAVALDNDERLPCQLLLVAVGVRPNTDLARQAGVKVRQGALVDRRMRTTALGVFAAGDVAEAPSIDGSRSTVLANWLNAIQQGCVAGYNLVGQSRLYPGAVRANALRLWDLSVISLGLVNGQGEWFRDEKAFVYRRLVTQGQRLVGFQQVGGKSRDVGVLSALVKRSCLMLDPSRLLEDGYAYFQAQETRKYLQGELVW